MNANKMYRFHYENMARKYRGRAGDAGFVDKARLAANGDTRGADLAWAAHDAMCRLFNHLEEKAEKK